MIDAANGSAAGVLAAQFAYSVASAAGPDITSSSGGAWNKRSLNTTVFNAIPGCSLSGNLIGLPVGTYFVDYSLGVFLPAGGAMVNIQASSRLRNTTDSTSWGVSQGVLLFPTSVVQLGGQATFTLAGVKTFELDLWANTTTLQGGAPNSTGENEVYVRCTILKTG